MNEQYFAKYSSLIGLKAFNVQDPSLCLSGFEAAVAKTEKCSTDDLRKLAVSTIQALYTFLKSVERNVALLMKVARFLPKLLSNDLLLEMNKVISSDQGTKIAMMLLDLSATTSSSLLNEPDMECVTTNLGLIISAISFCKTSRFPEPLQRFQKQFVQAVSIVYCKTHLMSINTKEISSLIGSKFASCSCFGCVKDDLRALISSDIVKKIGTNMNIPSSSGSCQPILNNGLVVELLCVFYSGDKRFAKVDLLKTMQLYAGTHLVWSKLSNLTDPSYMLGSGSALLESAAQHLKCLSSAWSYRMYILLGMRVMLAIENQLVVSRSTEDSTATTTTSSSSCSGYSSGLGDNSRCDLEKASNYITSALEALKQVADEITAENATEIASILSLDSKVLSQLLMLHGSLKYPAKLLKYTLAAYERLSSLPSDRCSQTTLKELEQVCTELRLAIRLSQVFTGLHDARDVDIHKSCFAVSDTPSPAPVDKLMASCTSSCDLVALCDSFVLGATHLIHSGGSGSPLYAKLSPKYQSRQFESHNARSLEELVLSLLECLNKGKVALGHRLSVFLHAAVCLTLARVQHLVFNDPRAAYRWTYKGLCQADRRVGYEMQQLRLEAMLMLMDLFDQVGASDQSLQYATELLMEVRCCPSQAVSSVVNFHMLRVWYRQQSASFQPVLDKFPAKRNDSSIDETTNRIVDVVNTVRSFLRRASASAVTEGPSCSFRLSHLFWCFDTLCSSGSVSVYHSYLLPSDRQSLLRFVASKSQSASAGAKATLSRLRAPTKTKSSSSVTTTVTQQLNERLLSCLNFDVVRTVRRHLISSSCAGDDVTFLSFVAAASSCCVSSECTLDFHSVNPMPKEIGIWSSAITSVLLADGDSAGSSARIRSRLLDVLQLSKCHAPGSSASVCVAALDESSDCLYLGRMDENTELMVSLPIKSELVQLVSRWHVAAASDKQQLYNNSILEKDKVWTEEERRAWRQSRKAADQLVMTALQELQSALGPWRILLCGQTVGAAGADGAEGEVSGVAKALFSASLEDNAGKTGSKKGAKTSKTGGAASTTAVSENADAETFKLDCKSWLDFVLLNTTNSTAAAAESGGKLSKPEAETILSIIAQSWDASLSAAEAKDLACRLVNSRFPAASAASQLSSLFAAPAGGAACTASAPSDYSHMSAEELKNQVKKRGLKPKTTKSLNIELLLQYDADHAASADDHSEVAVLPESDDASPTTETSDGLLGSVLLILDETLQCLPWECMGCLRASRCTRLPGLALLLANPLLTASSHSDEQQSQHQQQPSPTSDRFSMSSSSHHSSIGDGPECCSVCVRSGWSAVDISDNLVQTRDNLVPFLQPYAERWGWRTFAGVVPTKAEVKACHESSSLFVYCGHGAGEAMGSVVKYQSFARTPAAMLWGCSSGRLKQTGVFDPAGPALHYLLSGATFVVGNLWDMTSGDLDEMSMHFMRECLPDCKSRDRNKLNYRAVASVDMGEALVQARSVCRFKYANGCAPVVYGVCQHLSE